MSPAMGLAVETYTEDEYQYQKGVKYICEKGINKVPKRYILPTMERPNTKGENNASNLKLPIIDFQQLQGPNRAEVLKSLSKACEEYGFFQLINHGVSREITQNMAQVGRKFFELPFEERSKYMSKDMHSQARYGTSFNQNIDRVFCWRDFLKLNCSSDLSQSLPFWPSSPSQLRDAAVHYSKQTKSLYLKLVEAILESLGLDENEYENNNNLKEFEEGSQLLVINCYPSCPEPELTLGMPAHSDYGFLTLLLQDELVKGLQIQHQGKWSTVEPIPNSYVINVGDHLEIFSNGKYKSVIHRVLVNPSKSRISVASLHSLSFSSTIQPSPKLINKDNPKRYKDTNFSNFMEYITSREHKSKNFLESRKMMN